MRRSNPSSSCIRPEACLRNSCRRSRLSLVRGIRHPGRADRADPQRRRGGAPLPNAWAIPVALKIESAEITHKSDVGGVALQLSNASEVRDAYARIMSEVSRRAPNAKIDGVVVQRMAAKASK